MDINGYDKHETALGYALGKELHGAMIRHMRGGHDKFEACCVLNAVGTVRAHRKKNGVSKDWADDMDKQIRVACSCIEWKNNFLDEVIGIIKRYEDEGIPWGLANYVTIAISSSWNES